MRLLGFSFIPPRAFELVALNLKLNIRGSFQVHQTPPKCDTREQDYEAPGTKQNRIVFRRHFLRMQALRAYG